jgi:hypothetical protein
LNAECGINRMATPSTVTPGTIRVTAPREDLQAGTVTVNVKPVAIQDVLTQAMPQTLSQPLRAIHSSRVMQRDDDLRACAFLNEGHV